MSASQLEKDTVGFPQTLACLIRLLPSPLPLSNVWGVWERKVIDSRWPSMAAEKPLRRKQHAEELVPTLCARSTPVFFQGC